MSHLEERMETDLNYIRDWLWKIGDDVENALRNAKKTLILRDAEMAYDTILGDQPINRDPRQCDRLCHTFIARYLPGAGALREWQILTRSQPNSPRPTDRRLPAYAHTSARALPRCQVRRSGHRLSAA